MIKRWPYFLCDDTTSPPTGGGGSAPPSAPPAAPSPSEGGAPSTPTTKVDRIPDSPDEGGDIFAGMENDDFDLVEVPPDTPTPTGGEPGEVTPPQQPQTPQPAAPAAQATPQQPATPAVAPKQDAPSAPRSALDTAIDGFRTNHKAMSDWASANLFALSKEDADILETDAASFIPVLMGRVYSQALQATTNLIKNFVPNMINEGVAVTSARQAKASEAINEFYAAHPHLNPQQHGALVDKWARAFRAANPSASRQDAIKFVGNAVSTEAGIAPSANGTGRARPAPFAPARPGTRVQQPSQQNDPYEGMDMEYDQN